MIRQQYVQRHQRLASELMAERKRKHAPPSKLSLAMTSRLLVLLTLIGQARDFFLRFPSFFRMRGSDAPKF